MTLSQMGYSSETRISSNNFFSEIETMTNQIHEIIKTHDYLPKSSKPLLLLEDLDSQINKLFDQIQNQPLNQPQIDALTTLCRILNEDFTLQKIRDQNQRKYENFQNNSDLDNSIPTTDASFESQAFSTPRKVYAFPISLRGRKNTTPSPHNTMSVPCAELVQIQPIEDFNNSQSILNEDLSSVLGADLSLETDSDTPKNEQNEAAFENQISNERKMFDELLTQMHFEFNEHKIDPAVRTLEKIKSLAQYRYLTQEDQQYFEQEFSKNKLLISDIEDSKKVVKRILKELENEHDYHIDTSSKKNLKIQYKNGSMGKISIKIETEVDIALLNLLILFKEAEGYTSWSPFCSEAKEIKKISRTGNLMWLKWSLPPPISSREGFLIGNGFDRLDENGSILLTSQTIHYDKHLQERYNINIPSKSKYSKMDIEYVGIELKPLSKTKTQMKIVMMSDLNLKVVPQSLINWVVRKGASSMVEKIVKKAANLKGVQRELILKNNKEFYNWLENVVGNYFQAQNINN